MSRKNEGQIFQAVTIGGLALANRIVMGPMTRSRADEAGVLPAYAADYYSPASRCGSDHHGSNQYIGPSAWLPANAG